jgi:hypothetical protein
VLVRSVTTQESAWTDQDQAEVLALHQYRRNLCPCGCGHLSDDTLSDEESGPAFVADRTVCRARLALLEAQEAATTKTARHTGARLWRVDMKKR